MPLRCGCGVAHMAIFVAAIGFWAKHTRSREGENAIITIYHSRRSVADAACDVGLALIDERDLWIDRETAAQTFGASSIRCMPTTPIYWMLTLAKSTAVANGHEDAAPINGFMFGQRATVTS